MKNNRPVNLDLTTLKFPPMAIASILHRLSGVVLFIMTPFVLYVFALSLASESTFIRAKELLAQPVWAVMLWIYSAALIYHFLAGVRHLLMDLGLGEELRCGWWSALTVIALSAILSLLLGIWIW